MVSFGVTVHVELIQWHACSLVVLQFNNGGLAHYVIAAAAVASHNVKHAWVTVGACLGGIAFCGQFLCFAFQSFLHRSAVFLDKVLHKSEVLVLVLVHVLCH